MANVQDDAPLDTGSLNGSEEALVTHARPRGGSNSRAFKVAGLTTLACLLLASQVFTAYMVFSQKQQIHSLQKNSDRMSKQLTRSSQAVAPMRMHMPMNSLPLLADFTSDEDTKTPLTKLQDTAVVSVEKQLMDLMEDFQAPQLNETFLANLQNLKQHMNESEWKSFETWMRYWLVFQMAQQKPTTPTPQPASEIRTKCQLEAAPGRSRIGSYKPQCDEQGRYLPMQCWSGTGYCWCVDETGKVIEGTQMRNRRPDCQRDSGFRRMMVAPRMMQKTLSIDVEKDCVGVSEDGHGINFTSERNEEKKLFPFDQVVTVDNIQSLHPELLQPLVDSISSSSNGALLICGASTEKICTLIDHCIIKQILANVFSHMSSQVKEDLFISVSFLQFYPDGTAVDRLSPNRQTLKLLTLPVLGSLVGGLSELCVCSEEEAYAVYETCRDTLKTNEGFKSIRCSSLFSVAFEWKLHPEEVGSEICCSRLQLFSLAGGASRADLRGVNPLVKVMEQIPHGATTSDKLLPHLLYEALTGNSQTVLIYCINPQGLLDDETPSALTLAQKVRSIATKATVVHWCPRATEQQIRDNIMDLQTTIMSDGENEVHNTYKLAELMHNLQIVKNQSWEMRREESKKIKIKIKNCKSLDGEQQDRESTDTIKYLQDQLRQEMEEHIRGNLLFRNCILSVFFFMYTEGKGNVEKIQQRVARIQKLKEAVREETQKIRVATEKSDFCQDSQLEYNKAQERRTQLKEDHGRLIQEEVEKMERDLAEEQLLTVPQRELLVLTRERQVLVLQIEALHTEAQQAERDLEDQQHRHQRDLQCLREESLEVFRVFRQVSEEQRKMSEGRYRSVLLEAVQDAIYLSAQNQQLQADNKQLRKALGELKDTLVVRGEPNQLLNQQQ
ncbi:hypothetical protein Q8A73_010749 [Channa argus]|nr:hypothetical protein Q8A73_010749 [Channa argus]